MASHAPDSDDRREGEAAAQAIKTKNKINQVIQQFFLKGALTVVSSRVMLPKTFLDDGEQKQNKWFNVLIGDTDVLLKDMAEWRLADYVNSRPPPLIIEIYMDMAELTRNQTLVLLDEDGKRWDVQEALDRSDDHHGKQQGFAKRLPRVILERWTVEVGPRSAVSQEELAEPLSNVYKKAVVLFRSLFTQARLLPANRYWRKIQKQPVDRPSLKPRYRIINGDLEHPHDSDESWPALCPDDEPVMESFRFPSSNSPVGPLRISVQYRSNCEFRVDNAESLLSSRFMGMDDYDFKPSLPTSGRNAQVVPGSLPVNKQYEHDRPDLSEAYGSMSTFHQIGATGTSPISALRAARDQPFPDASHSPPRLTSGQRIVPTTKASPRPEGSGPSQRRPSVSFQPFKAGSFSSSSPASRAVPPSPGSSVGKPAGTYNHTRNRSSQYALPQAALRAPSITSEPAVTSSASSSPKPAPIAKYTSSFSNRRTRLSSGGTPRTAEEDPISSGRGSASSSNQPGSGSVQENEGASSGSMHTDEENISDLLNLLESKRELKSFNRTDSASQHASMRRTTTMLSRYQRMKESNTALTDSMSSSLLPHRSSSSSSRPPSSVPPMLAGNSVSTSSSPGKPISPHTPHTPAIPSRLSANSIIDYGDPRRSRSPRNRSRSDIGTRPLGSAGESSPMTAATALRSGATAASSQTAGIALPRTVGGTTAIDIPNSHVQGAWPFVRRSSSAMSHHARAAAASTFAAAGADEESEIYGPRAMSVPTEDRPELSSTELFALYQQRVHGPSVGASSNINQPSFRTRESRTQDGSQIAGPSGAVSEASSSSSRSLPRPRAQLATRRSRSSILEGAADQAASGSALAAQTSTSAPYRTRISHDGVSSGTSFTPGSRPGSHHRGSGRVSFTSRMTGPQSAFQQVGSTNDDEDMLFTMSDFGAARRSLEEGRGGLAGGSGTTYGPRNRGQGR